MTFSIIVLLAFSGVLGLDQFANHLDDLRRCAAKFPEKRNIPRLELKFVFFAPIYKIIGSLLLTKFERNTSKSEFSKENV